MRSGEEWANAASLPKITLLWKRSSSPTFARSTKSGRKASAHAPSIKPIKAAASARALKLKINERTLLTRAEKHDGVEDAHEQQRPHPPRGCRVKVDELVPLAIADEVGRDHHGAQQQKPQRKRRPGRERGEQRQQVA